MQTFFWLSEGAPGELGETYDALGAQLNKKDRAAQLR